MSSGTCCSLQAYSHAGSLDTADECMHVKAPTLCLTQQCLVCLQNNPT